MKKEPLLTSKLINCFQPTDKMSLTIKYIVLTIYCFTFFGSVLAQTFHGFSYDNFSGIYGTISNPANGVESKHRWHINGFSYNSFGGAAYGSIQPFEIEQKPNGFNGINYSKLSDNPEQIGSTYADRDILLPSVLWNINEKHSLGLLLRSRAFMDYNNFDSRLWQGINSQMDTLDFNIAAENTNSTTHYWSEIGLNYATVLINSNYHFLKVGGTLKYFLGHGATEVRGNLSGNYQTAPDNLTLSGDLVYLNTFPVGNTSNTNSSNSFINSAINTAIEGTGYGGDVGLVFEWRPRETNRVDVRSNSRAITKYKFRVSAAVLDIGTITYKGILKDSFAIANANLRGTNISGGGFIDALRDNANTTSNPKQGNVTFALPRSVNIGLDYFVLNNNNIYINLNYIQSLTTIADLYSNSKLNLITLTPRYETRKFSAFLPISYQTDYGIIAGAGIRYGPITVGSATLSSLFTEGKTTHFYFGLSLPLLEDLFR